LEQHCIREIVNEKREENTNSITYNPIRKQRNSKGKGQDKKITYAEEEKI
jgi:hypothetical protein